ncbi:MAG: ATP phosphoribosyltransferase regulatory subunit, partial [Candidatus Methylumidiphilus sp.]
AQEAQLFDILQRKAAPDLRDFFAANPVSPASARMLSALVELHGGADVIAEASRQLAEAGAEVAQALAELAGIASALGKTFPHMPVHFDLAELRGYHYHRGVVFAALVEGYGRELARGGRYDGIGAAFGRARPATGFSADLKVLARLAGEPVDGFAQRTAFAPDVDDESLQRKIESLRAEGWRVICELTGQTAGASALGCNHVLRKQDSGWELAPLAAA